MSLFHLNVKTGSRGGGQSAAAKNDYILREGKYAKGAADEVVFSESGHMPAWAERDPRSYWAAADEHERANGRLFVEVEVALPREFSQAQRIEAMRDLADEVTGRERLPYTWAIHRGLDEEGNDHNPHGHLQVSERGLDGHDRSPETWFKRYNGKNPEAGGARKTKALQPKKWLADLRAWLAEYQNERLLPEDRVDHRSYAEQGVLRLPQPHLGPCSWNALKNGRSTVRTERYEHFKVLNRDLVGWARTGEETVPWHEVDRSREWLYAMAEDDSVELPDGSSLWPAWSDLIEHHRATVEWLKRVWSLQWLRYDRLKTPLREVKLALVSAAEQLGEYVQWMREPDDGLQAMSEQPSTYVQPTPRKWDTEREPDDRMRPFKPIKPRRDDDTRKGGWRGY